MAWDNVKSHDRVTEAKPVAGSVYIFIFFSLISIVFLPLTPPFSCVAPLYLVYYLYEKLTYLIVNAFPF